MRIAVGRPNITMLDMSHAMAAAARDTGEVIVGTFNGTVVYAYPCESWETVHDRYSRDHVARVEANKSLNDHDRARTIDYERREAAFNAAQIEPHPAVSVLLLPPS